MSIEIERKFLVRSDAWRAQTTEHVCIRQGYLGSDGGFSTRVRIIDAHQATLTIKSSRAGLRRLEFEYPIPLADARQLLSLCQGAVLEKGSPSRPMAGPHGRSTSSKATMPDWPSPRSNSTTRPAISNPRTG